jgi:hypothetical protein
MFDLSTPNFKGQCATDFFIVTGGSPVPQLCGTNTGQHGKFFILFKSLPGRRP